MNQALIKKIEVEQFRKKFAVPAHKLSSDLYYNDANRTPPGEKPENIKPKDKCWHTTDENGGTKLIAGTFVRVDADGTFSGGSGPVKEAPTTNSTLHSFTTLNLATYGNGGFTSGTHYCLSPLEFNVGDTVKVHTRVVEGEKERTQVFAGIVIGRRGIGLSEMFTVRRISYGEGVERIFPIHSPMVEKVEVERHGKVRRAKLTYLRGRVGREAMTVRERE